MTPEFSHRVPLSEIGGQRSLAITARDADLVALARRLGVVRINALSAEADLALGAAGVEARGSISARVTQRCVASSELVDHDIDEPFDIVFVAPGSVEGDEIELSADDCDQIEHDGQAIDLGEAAAQTLALALDPFPRAPGADEVLAEAGVVTEDEEAVGAFAVLRGLK